MKADSMAPRSHYAFDTLTIVDVMGMHSLDVVWCRCDNRFTRDLQLLDMGLYPGSTSGHALRSHFGCWMIFCLPTRSAKPQG